MSARWTLRLLGAVELRDADGMPVRLPSRAAALLLAQLVLAPQRQHPREELVERLWPGVDAAAGRNRLRQTLSVLRSLVEPPGAPRLLMADRRAVWLAPDAARSGWHSDVQAVHDALARRDRDAVLAACGGELLPGHFEEWVLEARAHLEARIEALVGSRGGADALTSTPLSMLPAAVPTGPSMAPATGSPAAAGTPSTLPSYLTRLVGADRSVAALTAAAQAERLVVLLAPGGAGKTRVAVEAARALAARGVFDAVLFVALASCAGREQMLEAVLRALQQSGGPPSRERVLQAVAGRRVLLVLDNFEQLVEPAGGELAHWLTHAPALHLVVTSRRALGLDGEHDLPLAALPLPAPGAGPDELAANPAIALFVDRARAARVDFHLGARNREPLADIVRGLQGLPLAIELAAARVRSVGLTEMRALLAGGGALDLLQRGGPRAGDDPRHASMKAVLRWSWQLLDEPQRRVLAALAQCDGGAPLTLLATMTGQAVVAAALQVDALVAASVAWLDGGVDDAGTARYRTHEPMREFVLAEIGAAARAALQEAHAAAVAAWAAGLGREPDIGSTLAEWPNLVAALVHATHGGPAAAARAIDTVLDLRFALDDLSLPASALGPLRAVAHAAPGHRAAHVQALLAAQSFEAGEREAAAWHAEAALAATDPRDAEHCDVLRLAARVQVRLGVGLGADLVRAQAVVDEAMAHARAHARPDVEAHLLSTSNVLEMRLGGDRQAAAELHARALALWRRHGPETRVTAGLVNLSLALGFLGRPQEQLALLEEACLRAQRLGQRRLLGFACSVSGYALADLRRFGESAAAYRRCLEITWQDASWREWFYALWNLPRTLICLGQPETALRLMGFAERFYAERFGALGREDLPEARRTRRLGRQALGGARAVALWREGALLTMAEARQLAAAGLAAAGEPSSR